MNATFYFEKPKFFVSLLMCIFTSVLNRIPKKRGIFVLLAVSLIFTVNAQVTIGDLSEADKHAVLELKTNGDNKGLLLPGVPLVDLASYQPFASNDVPQGMLVYNTGTQFLKGLYYWNGTQWEITANNWFYMPSTTFDTDYTTKPAGNTKDLHAAYLAQFSTSSLPQSTGAPVLTTQIPIFGSPTDFYYYVISYDTTVFTNISINENGVMTYDLLKDGDESTYINIVFVRKR
jgi:hypothetical protein